MKILCCFSLFTLLSVFYCFSQDDGTAIVHIDKILPKGLILMNGWKFHAGDNLNWAKTDFNDTPWNTINPAIDIHNLSEIPKTSISWLRLHFYSGDSSDQKMSMLMQQSVASEIYLDDSLIYRFGTLSGNATEVAAYDPLWEPLQIPIKKNAYHVLAIRFQAQPNIFYTAIFETANPLLWIKVMGSHNAFEYYQEKARLINNLELIPLGIYLMMFILHMAFYLVYPSQKANLFFGIYAFSAIIGGTLQLVLFMFNHTVAHKFYLANSSLLFFFLCDLCIFTALNYLLQRVWDFTYKASIILLIAAIIFSASIYPSGWKLGQIVHLLIYVNIIRIAFSSVFKRKKGAWIIAIGGISSIVFFIVFILKGPLPGTSSFDSQDALRTAIFMMFILSLPASVSLFLALDFAFTNRTLKEKLHEVNELSQKNIIQEREKQQLLSSHNDMLEKQVAERTSKLKQSLENLQSTQSQLIQSEKMASLGELTAGIAHEIQNPLNFVNNFSEVNKELLAEMKDEIKKGNIDEVSAIADNVINNEEKINQHGKRADAIVKGMLQHTRSSAGLKEPTDINVLVDEYLRLAYHGLRAKDKDFNTDIKTDFDKSIDNINIIPQDIGRVLLNLYNNAFYAVTEKKKIAEVGYEPTISVSTMKSDSKITIIVKDNGNGIPEQIVDKIFQPFFTTKPTGQGTGLGLSLSYDIVKAHGGEIKVNTKEGEYTEFVILLLIKV
jgi:signal transduction histidine kinase